MPALLLAGGGAPVDLREMSWARSAIVMARLGPTTPLSALSARPGDAPTQAPFKAKSTYVVEAFAPGATSMATFLAHLASPVAAGSYVLLDANGGAIADVAPDATAFAHRNALHGVQFQGVWAGANDNGGARARAWVTAFAADLRPYTIGAYVNYIDLDLGTDVPADGSAPAWAIAYWGRDNYQRLLRAKAASDPTNVFNGPQSIPLVDVAASSSSSGGGNNGAADRIPPANSLLATVLAMIGGYAVAVVGLS
ncbi:Berberine and berberine like [Plasmodiophora brassicae]